MSDTALPALPGEVIDQAIDWAIRLTYNQADADTHAAFADWLALCDEHRLAWQRIQTLGGRFAGLPPELARQTLARLPEARLQRRQVFRLLGLFAALGAGAWGARELTPWQRLVADYSTRIGERQHWRLDDGSRLDLNTDSAVALRFDAEQRLLVLLRGELHLHSGTDHDSQRPLRVSTRDGLLEALGTRFSVRLGEQASVLGVSEGAVRLQPLEGGSAAIARAGESWRLGSTLAERLATPPPSASWRDGLLLAREQPLAELLAELGRYRHGHLGCDPAIAGLPISGNFQLDDIDATLRFIARAHGLRLHSVSRYWIRLSSA
ncbi:FecR domain-containing protein [Stutzerimonas kirkiae]|uniref:Iron dicitrate transport regulator FecR n=1 Tax=Stutzerimonas kirkiae TaxID=2211392 RepID=A0A4Q9R203_9GAMM|nr:FecR family protein [Stutzerimonas kirkiae]TBU93293.1 iron dicitrate transport regulator FecR [Stutzerimonas kirkiae]TBV01427.1 iron dicitrate transport regulator FecR [Stutzerimonas kirkiae]TBV06877.1 iron dicitrate transport regulator FecR [Stutzerimonas kirkiae]